MPGMWPVGMWPVGMWPSGAPGSLTTRTVYSMLVDPHGAPIADAPGRLVIVSPQRLGSGEWIAGVIAGTSDAEGRIDWGLVPTGIDVVVEVEVVGRRSRVAVPSGSSDLEI